MLDLIVPNRINRNILECKCGSNQGKSTLSQCINRNILECKGMKQLMIGGGIALIGTTLVLLHAGLFWFKQTAVVACYIFIISRKQVIILARKGR